MHGGIPQVASPVSEAGQLTDIPALDQTEVKLAETCTKHLLDSLVMIRTARQYLAQFIGLPTTAAPERELTDLMEQRGNEDLLLMFGQNVARNIASLHCRMKRPRQQFL